jgi:hypothetical protein
MKLFVEFMESLIRLMKNFLMIPYWRKRHGKKVKKAWKDPIKRKRLLAGMRKRKKQKLAKPRNPIARVVKKIRPKVVPDKKRIVIGKKYSIKLDERD